MRIDLFLVGWSGMVGALMVPTIEPFLALYGGVLRTSGLARAAMYALVVAPFVAVWVATGAAAWAVLAWSEGDPLARGGLIAFAGVYQLSPLSRICLAGCRSPIGFLLRYGTRAGTPRGALELGGRYALICLGCCAGLWIAFVGAGAMSLTWMAALALLVFVQKWHRHGEAFARAAGVVLLMLAVPTALGAEMLTEQSGIAALVLLAAAAVSTFRSRRPAVA